MDAAFQATSRQSLVETTDGMNRLTKVSNLAMRDRLRHGILPIIQSGIERVSPSGLGSLGHLSNADSTLISQASRFGATLESALKCIGSAEKPLDVYFLTMIGGHRYLFATELVIASILRSRGHTVRFVVCDQSLSACEVKKVINREDWDRSCARCWSFGRHIFKSYGFEIYPVSTLASSTSSVPLGEGGANDKDIEEIVDASLLKHFMVGRLEDADSHAATRRAYLQSARTSQSVGLSLAELGADRVIMSHGIYSTWGPAREALLAAGIPVVCYGKGKKRHTVKFNWTTEAPWWDVSSEWLKVKDNDLSNSEEAAIEDYLASRRDHRADSMVYNRGKEESVTATKERLGLSGDGPTFALFTNVLWDAASAHREIAFSDPIDWVLKTIDWFVRRPNKQLIVKIHPAETVIGTRQPFIKLARERFPTLPNNVRLIGPDEESNSWSIIKVADLGLVHTSTVGMELPLEGVPCAVVSRTHFRDKGFTIDIDSQDEYFALLEAFDPDAVDREALRVYSKRYASLLFNRYQFPFDFFDEPSHADVRGFDFTKLGRLGESSIVRHFIPIIEQGQGEFLIPAHEVPALR